MEVYIECKNCGKKYMSEKDNRFCYYCDSRKINKYDSTKIYHCPRCGKFLFENDPVVYTHKCNEDEVSEWREIYDRFEH